MSNLGIGFGIHNQRKGNVDKSKSTALLLEVVYSTYRQSDGFSTTLSYTIMNNIRAKNLLF